MSMDPVIKRLWRSLMHSCRRRHWLTLLNLFRAFYRLALILRTFRLRCVCVCVCVCVCCVSVCVCTSVYTCMLVICWLPHPSGILSADQADSRHSNSRDRHTWSSLLLAGNNYTYSTPHTAPLVVHCSPLPDSCLYVLYICFWASYQTLSLYAPDKVRLSL